MMYKIAFGISLLFLIFYFRSCIKSEKIEIDLSKGHQIFELLPKDRILTTSCRLRIEGEVDCNVTIQIKPGTALEFSEGKIEYDENFECYDNGKMITVLSDSCTSKSKLIFSYNFSARYFGQRTSDKYSE